MYQPIDGTRRGDILGTLVIVMLTALGALACMASFV